MLTSPSRISVEDIGFPGAKTPYYREIMGTVGPDPIPCPGKNFTDYELFALQTRVEADPDYSAFNNENSTSISFRPKVVGDRMVMFLCVDHVARPDFRRERNPKTWNVNQNSVPIGISRIETLKPEWLQDVTDFWLTHFQDYVVILSDRYPIGRNPLNPLPLWWINEVLPMINLRQIIQRVWFSEDPDKDLSGYDYFYHDGSVFLRMVDPNNDQNIGQFTPHVGDLLNTGDQAITRNDFSYGDYSVYFERYHDLQVEILNVLEKYYDRGVIALDPVKDADLIVNWKMVPLKNEPGLYELGWKDLRLTSFDGPRNLIQRQLHPSRWDYQQIFYHVGADPVVIHQIGKMYTSVTTEVLRLIGEYAPIPVSNYQQAVKYADEISKIKDSARGTVDQALVKFSERHPEGAYIYNFVDQVMIESVEISRKKEEKRESDLTSRLMAMVY